MRRPEALFYARYKIRIAAEEDAGETVVSKLKRQFDKHAVRFEHILKTKTRKGETAEGKVKRTKIGENTEVVEREEPEQKQPKQMTVEAYLDGSYTCMVGLARAGVEALPDKPGGREVEASKSQDYVQSPLDITLSYHVRAKRFAATLPRDRAVIARASACLGLA